MEPGHDPRLSPGKAKSGHDSFDVKGTKPSGRKQATALISEAQPGHDLGHPQADVAMQKVLPLIGKKVGPGHDLNNSKEFLPCIDKVEAGHQSDLTQSTVDVALKTKMSFVLGDKAHCFEEAISNAGPSLCLKDDEQQTFNIFMYSIKATNVAASLVNQRPVMCGYGVEATPMIGLLDIESQDSDPASWNLLTHPESRGAVATCLDSMRTSLMIGSPGIGKSFSLLYALQQALLYDRALVLLYSCRQFETYLF
jgi:hypothetical protein